LSRRRERGGGGGGGVWVFCRGFVCQTTLKFSLGKTYFGPPLVKKEEKKGTIFSSDCFPRNVESCLLGRKDQMVKLAGGEKEKKDSRITTAVRK